MKQLVIIDIGSNSIRLILVRIGKSGNFKILHDLRESVRLEKDMGEERIIKADRIDKAVKTMQMFRNLCDAVQTDEIIVVATEAVRHAANQQEFLDRIERETGFKIRVLSGAEEAYYDYIGIVNSMDIQDGIMMDLGGGSTELLWIKEGKIKYTVSIPFGSINVSQQYQLSDEVQSEHLQALELMLTETYQSIPWLNDDLPPLLIGIGGTFRNLGKIDRRRKNYPLELAHNYHMPAQDVFDIQSEQSQMNLKQRRAVKGLSKERADIFVGAATIISRFIQLGGFEELAISGYGMREGIIYEYIGRHYPGQADALDFSLCNNQLNYMLDKKHAFTIWKITISLYQQLHCLMQFDQNYERVIKTAALLHDTGIVINYYQQNEHLFYLLLNTGLNGLTHREIVLSAFIASFRSSGRRQQSMLRYRSLLTESDLQAIPAIGILLRMARSLDRSMSGMIQSVKCDVRDDKVIIKTEALADIGLEIYDALRYCNDFKKIFKKDLFIL